MEAEVFIWALAATVIAGIQAFLLKVVANQGRNSALNSLMMYGFSGIAALAAAIFFYDMPDEIGMIILLGVLGGVTHAVGNFFRIESLKSIDSVIFFPLNKVLGPLLVVIGGLWFFSESLTLWEIIGIALSICVPLLLVSSVERHRQNNLGRGITLMAISTALTSAGILFSKQGTTYDSTLMWIMFLGQAAGTVTSLILFLREKHVRDGRYFGITKEDIKLGLWSALLSFTGFWAMLKAVSMGQVSIVYVIHAHYILIPIVLSIWWYREHIDARKVAAVALSFLAIGLLI